MNLRQTFAATGAVLAALVLFNAGVFAYEGGYNGDDPYDPAVGGLAYQPFVRFGLT